MTELKTMNERILQRYTGRKPDDASGEAESAGSDEAEDCGAFGWLRGRERGIMLELRRKNGNVSAVGYAWLHEVEFDPSVGLVLSAASRRITIRGRNLNAEVRPGVRLLQCLLRHRVSFIQEADESRLMQAKDDEIVIEAIEG